MTCLNCGAVIFPEQKYCDSLCKHGFMQKTFKEMEKNHEELLQEYLKIRRELFHE